MKNFMDKPITWGGYLKLCGVSMLVSTVITGATWYKMRKDWGL